MEKAERVLIVQKLDYLISNFSNHLNYSRNSYTFNMLSVNVDDIRTDFLNCFYALNSINNMLTAVQMTALDIKEILSEEFCASQFVEYKKYAALEKENIQLKKELEMRLIYDDTILEED